MKLEKRIEKLISSAIKETPISSGTNSERMANVGEARSAQLEKERAQKRPSPIKPGSSAIIVPMQRQQDDDEYPDYENELFDDGDD